MNKLYFIIPMLMLLFSCQSIEQEVAKNILELDSRVDEAFNESHVPGLSFLVINKTGEIIYDKSLGYSDLATKKKYNKETIQNIASVSKTIISVAVMKAVDLGYLKLDVDINQYLPFTVTNPSYPNDPITVRQLATHTSSIMDNENYIKSYYFMNPETITADDLDGDYKEYADIVKKNKLIDESLLLEYYLTEGGQWNREDAYGDEKPGVESDYSNIGATLAAYVVEQASGMTYEDFTMTHIFKPLGMNRTGWDMEMMEHEDFATRYFTMEKKVPKYYLITKADGGLYTSTSDYSKLMIELIKGYNKNSSFLSQEAIQTMFSNQLPKSEDFEGGIFWELDTEVGAFKHDGSDPGVTTLVSYNNEKERAMIVFTNIESTKESMGSIIKIWNAIGRYDWTAN